MTVTAVTQPVSGTVVNNGTAACTFTPDRNFAGTDSFDYTIADAAGAHRHRHVTVTITNVDDDPPVAVDDTAPPPKASRWATPTPVLWATTPTPRRRHADRRPRSPARSAAP